MTKVTCTVKTELTVEVRGSWDENQSLGLIRKEAGASAVSAITEVIKRGKADIELHTTGLPRGVVTDVRLSSSPEVTVSVIAEEKS